MAFSANCPACGAPVVFKSSVSFHAVCEFCRSTLVRHGGNLENLGKMADLLEDASPIQLGTEGNFRGVHFATVGRIQLRYAAGVWNEWYLLFDDQRGGWLSDANGEYVVSFLKAPGVPLPEFATLETDTSLDLAGQEFVVTNKEEAMCIAGEGELPFAFGAGYAAQLADLRGMASETGGAGKSNAFASIDYSETPPLFFVGESMPFAALKFNNLRDTAVIPRAPGEVLALQCPACGGPISLHDNAVKSVACQSCLSVLSAENSSLKILQRVKATEKIDPLIPLGSVGKFLNKEWTVIGFQARQIEGGYVWHEYLLHHPHEGFRWLTNSEQHWNWVTPLTALPHHADGQYSVRYNGENFMRYASDIATTFYVIGEFNWVVTVNETWLCTDFVAPPRMLSRESSNNETTWSIGEYLPASEIYQAFNLKSAVREPTSVGANQPNPRRESHTQVFSYAWKFMLLATIVQFIWAFVFGGQTLLDQKIIFSPNQTEAITTPMFKLGRDARTLTLKHNTDIDNNWVGLNLALIERNTGKTWQAIDDVSYWHGVDDGESWNEGDREPELLFRDVPAGEYYLVIDSEISEEKPVAVTDRIRVVRDQAAWSNYILLMIFLIAFPLISRVRVASFEAERWAKSDFNSSGEIPIADDSSDDD
ncbi:MAG: DUF4178 domain-containing protein [Rhodocyclaceae bacterium]|nr:DUF4178 domain-containing protein [Rhodocyclaceae bacterium]MBP6109592.1 DUF4178 domain-containing protein [Rhodocyclaceae bacterium]